MNVISRFDRLLLYTAPQLVEQYQNQSNFIETRIREKIRIEQYKDFLRKFAPNIQLHSKMKDYVNGKKLNENDNDLILDQKHTYSNGISNGHR